MKKNVAYKEPKGYFNAEMLKVAKEWDRTHGKESEGKTTKQPSKTTKK